MPRESRRWRAQRPAMTTPRSSTRALPSIPARVALVVVDMQYASGSRKEGLGRLLRSRATRRTGRLRFDRIERAVVPTIQRLLEFFRARALRVMHLTVGSELPDYSDLLPHCAAFAAAIGNTEGRREHEILAALAAAPRRGRHQQDHHERVSLLGFERLLRVVGDGAAPLHGRVDQLVRRGHRAGRRRPRLSLRARRGRLRRGERSACTTRRARTSSACSAAWRPAPP